MFSNSLFIDANVVLTCQAWWMVQIVRITMATQLYMEDRRYTVKTVYEHK